MSNKLPVLFLLCALNAGAQTVPWITESAIAAGGTNKLPTAIERTFVEGNNTFVVRYEYDPRFCTIPATIPPGQPHYSARISVTLNGNPFGNPFNGEVTPNGCFEDVPSDMVDKARHAPAPKPIDPLQQAIINGYVTNGTMLFTNLWAAVTINVAKIPTNIVLTNNETRGTINPLPVANGAFSLLARGYNASTKENQMDFLRLLVTSGEFCKVRGHVWNAEYRLFAQSFTNVFYKFNGDTRKCAVCGLIQTKQTEWK